VATGETIAEVEAEMSAAIRFHLEVMQEDGQPIPAPSCQVHDVEAAA
jgi:predicted RNase H-like HicB family nuclease